MLNGDAAQGLNRPLPDLTLPQGLPHNRFCILLSVRQDKQKPRIREAFMK